MDEVGYRSLDPVTVVALSGRADGREAIGPVVGELIGRLDGALLAAGRPLIPPGVFWYEPDGEGMRIHVSYRAEEPPVPGDGWTVVTLPGVAKAATLIHRGDMTGIADAWATLMRRAEADGHRFAGPTREVYLVADGHEPGPDWVTELQLPVEPA